MSRKLPKEDIKFMQTLYGEGGGISVADVARKTNVSYTTAYGHTRLVKRGFESWHKYMEYLAKNMGFASLHEYRKHMAEKRFKSWNEYQENTARKMGFTSLSKYNKDLAEKRKKRPVNQKLGILIKERLTKLGKEQKWLAEQLGITEGAVTRYKSGEITPKNGLQERLFSLLEVPYHTLEDLLE